MLDVLAGMMSKRSQTSVQNRSNTSVLKNLRKGYSNYILSDVLWQFRRPSVTHKLLCCVWQKYCVEVIVDTVMGVWILLLFSYLYRIMVLDDIWSSSRKRKHLLCWSCFLWIYNKSIYFYTPRDVLCYFFTLSIAWLHVCPGDTWHGSK